MRNGVKTACVGNHAKGGELVGLGWKVEITGEVMC